MKFDMNAIADKIAFGFWAGLGFTVFQFVLGVLGPSLPNIKVG